MTTPISSPSPLATRLDAAFSAPVTPGTGPAQALRDEATLLEEIECAAHRLNTALTAMFFDRNQTAGPERPKRGTQSALMNDVRRNLEQAMLRKAELEALLEEYHRVGTSNEWDHPSVEVSST